MRKYIIGLVSAFFLLGCGAADDLKAAIEGTDSSSGNGGSIVGTWATPCVVANESKITNDITQVVSLKGTVTYTEIDFISEDKFYIGNDCNENRVRSKLVIEGEYTIGDETKGAGGENAREINSVITKSRAEGLHNKGSDFIKEGRSVFSMFILNGNTLTMATGTRSRLGFTVAKRVNNFSKSTAMSRQ